MLMVTQALTPSIKAINPAPDSRGDQIASELTEGGRGQFRVLPASLGGTQRARSQHKVNSALKRLIEREVFNLCLVT